MKNNRDGTNLKGVVDSEVKCIIMNRAMVTFLLLVITSFVDDSAAETCGRIADVVFVIDSSSSIWPPYFSQQLDFVKQVVNAFDVGHDKTRIGALTFSNRTITEFQLNTHINKQDILDAISAIEFAAGDDTETFDALRVLRTELFRERNGDRPDVPNIAIVLTDGDSSDMASTVYEANLTKQAGVAIFAIGIGDEVNKEELEEIASSPKSDYMHILVNFTELQSDAFTKLLSHKACKAPLTTPIRDTTTKSITTTTTTPRATTTKTTTTTTEAVITSTMDDSVAKTCGRIADVVFVIDSSRSIWPPYFSQQVEFVKQVVKAFDVGRGKTRIGALTFSDRTITEFYLNTHDTKQEILDAISAIKFAAGPKTNTFDALDVLRRELFSESNGDRSDVPNIAIILTDGESSYPASTVHEANLTRKAGVAIFAIGIGNWVNRVELEEIASSPKSDYMHTLENFTELQSDAFAKLLSHKVCTVPLNMPTTSSTSKSSKSTTTTPETSTRITATTTTEAVKIWTTCQGKPADILFILDVSTSIGIQDFKTQMWFVKDVVDILDIDSGKARVGIVTFSSYAVTEFQLGEHQTKNAIMEAIDRVKFRAGSTNTSHALSILPVLFQPGSGSRERVTHIAIVITDGHSKDPRATRNMAKIVHDEGIYAFAIGVGNNPKIQELQAIASKPSDQYVYQVSDYNALNSIKNSLASKVCEACATDTDVLFAVNEFAGKDKKNVMLFIQKVGGGFDIDSGRVRVGVLHKCNAIDIALGQHTSKDLFVDEIEAAMTENKGVPFLEEIQHNELYHERPEARKKLVLLISDKFSDWEETTIEIKRLKLTTEVNVIGVGNTVSRNELQQLASSQSDIFMVEDTAKLQDIAVQLHKRLCSS